MNLKEAKIYLQKDPNNKVALPEWQYQWIQAKNGRLVLCPGEFSIGDDYKKHRDDFQIYKTQADTEEYQRREKAHKQMLQLLQLQRELLVLSLSDDDLAELDMETYMFHQLIEDIKQKRSKK